MARNDRSPQPDVPLSLVLNEALFDEPQHALNSLIEIQPEPARHSSHHRLILAFVRDLQTVHGDLSRMTTGQRRAAIRAFAQARGHTATFVTTLPKRGGSRRKG